jgi:hypothetical protein
MQKRKKIKNKLIKFNLFFINNTNTNISHIFVYSIKIILVSLYMNLDTFIPSSDSKSGAWPSW